MANPVTYNQGTSIAGSLKSSVISVGVSPSLNISGYNWRNGFENNNIWVIYSDTYSQGQTTQGNAVPTIWATPAFTDAGLLNLINVLPARAGQTAFTTLSSAISWLYGENKYFLSNQNYPQIVTENLLAFWDAGFSASYPNVGTTFYNLSTTGNGTLTNGPTWTNNYTKSYFNFDGTDDVVVATGINLQQNFTLEAWINMTDRTNFGIFGQGITNTSQGLHIVYNFGSRGMVYGLYSNDNDYGANWIGDTGKWYHVLFTYNNSNYDKQFYANGVLQTPSSSTENQYTGSGDFRIGNTYSTGSASPANGKIAKARIYNKVLTQDEVLQNYYQAPIVTSGLVFNIDAANLVSYPSVGTAAYNLTGSNILTLSNGLSYQSGYGGYFLSDGTDDGLTTPDASNLDLNTFTLEGWVWWNEHKNFGSLLVKGPGGSGNLFNYSFFFYAGNIVCGFGDGSSFYNVSISTPPTNTWHHIVGTYDGSNLRFYLNGVLTASAGIVATPNQNSDNLNVIQPDYPINGRVANARVYNRALTATEVLQNYNAYQDRFKTYYPYANGGTVTTVNIDGINYRVHTFTTSGTLTVIASGYAEVLVVAGGGPGGGQGGNDGSGGGGAGGLVFNSAFELTAGNSMSVVVGAGGAGVSASTKGQNGSNSVLGSTTAIGGGAGGSEADAPTRNGNSGGSGGGAGGYSSAHLGGAGTLGQGNKGGDNKQTGGGGINYGGGGGGGAGAPGEDGNNTILGQLGYGGSGLPYSIPSTTTYYAGGGGCGGGYGATGGTGGAGGGGNGGNSASGQATGTSGTANTGGGGGGAGGSVQGGAGNSGSGGSGIIIVRYVVP